MTPGERNHFIRKLQVIFRKIETNLKIPTTNLRAQAALVAETVPQLSNRQNH